MDFMTVTVMRNAGFEAFDNIAGGETAGIPFRGPCRRAHGAPDDLCAQKAKGLRARRTHRGRHD